MTVYFDTNVILYLGQGLRDQQLPQHVKARIVLSGVSAIELVSQIAINPHEALSAVHAFESWLDTAHATLLDWSEIFIANRVFGLTHNESVFNVLQQALRVCYRAEVPNAQLVADAKRFRDFNEGVKQSKARLLSDAAIAARQTVLPQTELRTKLAATIVKSQRIKYAQQNASVTDADIEAALSAYCEFHADLMFRAVNQVEFNFFSREHLNDFFDAEQLAYLADERLHLFTTDIGYRSVRNSAQRDRIHIVDIDDVRDPARAFGFLTAAFG